MLYCARNDALLYTLFLSLIRMLIVCVETIYTLAKIFLCTHTRVKNYIRCFSLSLVLYKKIRNFLYIYQTLFLFFFSLPCCVIEFQGIIVVAAYTRLLLFSRHWGLVFFVIYIYAFFQLSNRFGGFMKKRRKKRKKKLTYTSRISRNRTLRVLESKVVSKCSKIRCKMHTVSQT